MQRILIVFFLFLTSLCEAQVALEQKDIHNLIAISELYSNNPNATGSSFAKAIDSLRTPILNHIADALIETGKGDKTILESRFLARPTNDELLLWYVIREIHYNRTSKSNTPRPDSTIAKEVLSKNIDERWLLDNYYYRIHGGIGKLFNDANLSNYNFNMDSLGFKNKTEQAIFFLNMMDALVGSRFKVLSMMKNNKKILEFCDKLPMFNGQLYYYYQHFDYADFDWKGYDKTESYNERHIGSLYNILLTHYGAAAELKDKKEAQEIYFNSILHEPMYFGFSEVKDDLQFLFDKSK